MAVLFFFAIAVEVGLALIAANIWSNKGGDPVVGGLIGFFLGILGLILVAVLTPQAQVTGLTAGRSIGIEQGSRGVTGRAGIAPRGPGVEVHAPAAARECPHCWEPMRRDGSVCPHCGRESIPWAWRSGRWWARDPAGNEMVLDEATWEWLDPEAARAAQPSGQVRFEIVVTDTGPNPQAVTRALGQTADYSASMAKRMLRRVPVGRGAGAHRGASGSHP